MSCKFRLESLEQRLTPSSFVSLVSRADPAAPSASAGGASDFSGGSGPRISADGRYTAYTSTAGNLITGQLDANNASDVFLYDRVLDSTVLVSHSASSSLQTANATSDAPTISADGRYVLYESKASDLVSGFVDNNTAFYPDLYLFDRVLGTNRLVSHSSTGLTSGANQQIDALFRISGHGEAAIFSTSASNLVAGFVGNGSQQAFMFDGTNGVTTLLSHTAASPTTASTFGGIGGVSDDGQRVLYTSGAPSSNAYVLDRPSGNVILVSHKYDSLTTPVGGGGSIISADGKKVLFASTATTLVPGFVDNNTAANPDFYFSNLDTGAITLVTHAATSLTSGANQRIVSNNMSADGSTVVYDTKSTNLVGGFTAGKANVSIVYAYQVATGNTVLVSRAAGTSTQGANETSLNANVSADGKIITFVSLATDLIPGFVDNDGGDHSTGQGRDAFAFDLAVNSQTLISHRAAAVAISGNGGSEAIQISGDGGTMLLSSYATDLQNTQFDGNGQVDVFLFVKATGTMSLASKRVGTVSATAGGQQESINSHWVQQSADGRFVTYVSTAINVAAGQADGNLRNDVFLFDRLLNTTQLVSHSFGATATAGNYGSSAPVISRDGRYVAYCSWATDLVPGFVDSNGLPPPNETHDYCDVFLFDRVTGINQLASRKTGTTATGGNLTSGECEPSYDFTMCISDDGQYVSYVSNATDLISGYVEGNTFNQPLNVYVFDRTTGTNAIVSHDASAGNVSGNRRSYEPSISGDGRYIAFWGPSTNLVTGSTTGADNIFLYDQQAGTTTLVSHAYGNTVVGGDAGSATPVISKDGNFVMYTGVASNLVGGADSNGTYDIFLYDRQTGVNTLVSHVFNSDTTAGDKATLFSGADVAPRAISDDGRFVAYTSGADNLVGGFIDNNGTDSPGYVNTDIYLFDRMTGNNLLVSHSSQSPTDGSNNVSRFATISGDGRFVAFASSATNLTPGVGSVLQEDYLYDRKSGSVTLVSHSSTGQAGNGDVAHFGLSAGLPWVNQDGTVIVFAANSDNLVANDFNGFEDIFAYVTPPPQVASLQINDGSAQRSMVKSITVNFDEPVFFNGDPASAFTLTRNGSVGSVQQAVSSFSNNPNGSITLTFGGSLAQFGSLMDGKYTLTIDASKVSNIAALDGNGDGVAGDNWVSPADAIFRLFGDADGNGIVDGIDFGAFRSAFNTNGIVFDFDGNGVVDGTDFGQFRQRFGVMI